jgi:hypothetical protein
MCVLCHNTHVSCLHDPCEYVTSYILRQTYVVFPIGWTHIEEGSSSEVYKHNVEIFYLPL